MKIHWGKIIISVIIITMVVMLIGACKTTPTSGESTNSAASETEATVTREGTIEFWISEQPEEVYNFLNGYIDEWNQTHSVKAELQSFPWLQYSDALTTGVTTGEGPDVFIMTAGDWLRYAAGDLALPLDDYFPQYLKEDLLPASLEGVTLNGHIYSIPYEMEPVVLYYDKVLFEEEGLEPPKDWVELMNTAEQLTTEDRFGILIAINPDVYENFIWYPFLWMAGGEVLNKDLSAAAIDQTSGGAQALQLWCDLVTKGYAANTTGGNDSLDERFPTGRAGMYVSGYWVYGWLKSDYPDFVERVGIVPIPPPTKDDPNITIYGGCSLMVSSRTEFPEDAAEFAVQLFGAEDIENNIKWNTELWTQLSPRKSMIETLKDHFSQFPHNFFADTMFPIARPEPAYSPEVSQAVYEAIQDVIFNGLTGEEAVDIMADKINTYFTEQ